eukprot:5723676-Pyramimonas_sp.AAC.1
MHYLCVPAESGEGGDHYGQNAVDGVDVVTVVVWALLRWQLPHRQIAEEHPMAGGGVGVVVAAGGRHEADVPA